MGNLIDGQVFSYVVLRGFPHEGSLSRIEFDQKAAVAVQGPKWRVVWGRFVEPGGDRVDFGGRGGGPESRYALAVLDQEDERGEA